MENLQSEYTKLESSLVVTKKVNDKLLEQIESLERQVNSNAQYSRRECIEVAGIPKNVSDGDLEQKVCDVFSSIGLDIKPDDIEACHRLRNERTIVKFLNRKKCMKILTNKKLLKDVKNEDLGFDDEVKLYVNESLCPNYRFIFWRCRILHQQNKIFSYFTTNGTIKIRVSENSNVKVITHINDLKKLFPGESFEQAK